MNPQKYQYPHGAMSSPEPSNQEAPSAEIAGDPSTKYTKDEVNYRPSGSSKTRCGNCKFFTSSAFGGGVCSLVAGDIQPTGVSDLWQGTDPGLGDLIQ